jgi:hypothetical protein
MPRARVARNNFISIHSGAPQAKGSARTPLRQASSRRCGELRLCHCSR